MIKSELRAKKVHLSISIGHLLFSRSLFMFFFFQILKRQRNEKFKRIELHVNLILLPNQLKRKYHWPTNTQRRNMNNSNWLDCDFY